MKSFLATISILFFFSSNSQDLTSLRTKQDSIRHLTNLIINNGTVTSSAIGYVGLPSKQYYRFVYLLTMLNDNDFLQIVKTSTGCLKVYAYMGLYHDKYKNLKEVQDDFKLDTTRVITESGDYFETMIVSHIINQITDWYSRQATIDILTSIKKSRKYYKAEFKNISSPDN